ncbi:MAG: hypothetical protein DHS20C06_14210 [Hyphobacterium sp.]|nr:MAG: hypothetical protein DHS20C06_14210 [Hyphobacterium sp.]
MWGSDPKLKDALQTLGLNSDATLGHAKAAFRQCVKALHPDRTPPTTASLAQLADAITAIRTLEKARPVEIELNISPREAVIGGHRAWSNQGRSGVFRISAGIKCGTIITAIGDSSLAARISISEQASDTSKPEHAVNLEQFITEFASEPPATRFANWLRRARSAA